MDRMSAYKPKKQKGLKRKSWMSGIFFHYIPFNPSARAETRCGIRQTRFTQEHYHFLNAHLHLSESLIVLLSNISENTYPAYPAELW